jgi:hypothetical protein
MGGSQPPVEKTLTDAARLLILKFLAVFFLAGWGILVGITTYLNQLSLAASASQIQLAATERIDLAKRELVTELGRLRSEFHDLQNELRKDQSRHLISMENARIRTELAANAVEKDATLAHQAVEGFKQLQRDIATANATLRVIETLGAQPGEIAKRFYEDPEIRRKILEELNPLPSGALLPWHRDILTNGKMPLPEGWVLCDGERVLPASLQFRMVVADDWERGCVGRSGVGYDSLRR